LFCALCLAHAQAAAPTFDEAPAGTGTVVGDPALFTSYASAVAGATLEIAIRVNGTGDNVVGCSDSTNGAWTEVAQADNGAANFQVWRFYNSASGAIAGVQCDLTSSLTYRGVSTAYTGAETASAIEAITTGTFASTTSVTTSNIVTTYTDELTLCHIALDGNSTIDPESSENERTETSTRVQEQDKDATAAGTFTHSWTLGTAAAGSYICFGLKSTTSVLSGGFNPILGPTSLPGSVQ